MKEKTICFFVLVVIMLISSCGPGPAATHTAEQPVVPAPTAAPAQTAKPAPTAVTAPPPAPMPAITLGQGDFYFSVDGKKSFIFSRNVAGYRQQDYTGFINWAKSGGSSFVRVQLNGISQGYTGTGKVNEAWAAEWDKVFDTARSKGIYVLPVFSSWFEWNAGDNPYSDYSTWNQNKFNKALGGPAKSPAELFKEGSAARTAWLEWVKALVERWKGRDNIIGWEIFSEVNFISGAKESSGVDLVNTAAEMIRSADPGRPVTASIADTGDWQKFYRDADLDFIQVHPYPPFALDKFELELIRKYMDKYDKPVLVGESGFAGSPEEYPEGNVTGDRHAIWAGVVSGAMNGRAFYWEDSFALFYPKLSMPWMDKYKTLELPASEFVKDMDFTGFAPLRSKTARGVWGAAVGSDTSLIGWFRDAGCEPPDYKMKAALSNKSVTITVPGKAKYWHVEFYSTADGVTLIGSVDVTRKGKTIKIPLPEFTGDIAFKAYAD